MELTEWIEKEQVYVDTKNAETNRRESDREVLKEEPIEGSTFWQDITSYVRRAELMGADTLQGRQALAKGLMVYKAWVEEIVAVYGELPPGGVPSGVTD